MASAIRDSIPRVGKVTLHGGASLSVLHPESAPGRYRESLFRSAHALSDTCPDMVGYFMVAWDRNGGWQKALRWDRLNPAMPWRLLPAFVEELARAALIEEDIEDEIDRRFVDES
jgi:hypothetical protein